MRRQLLSRPISTSTAVSSSPEIRPPGPIRTLLADDEEFARAALRFLLRGRPEFEIVGVNSNGLETLDAIHWFHPDLVFLDVDMPPFDGFEVLARIRLPRKPAFIFTTASDRFACRAFDVGALDYLVKPLTRSRFDLALCRAREFFHARSHHLNSAADLRP